MMKRNKLGQFTGGTPWNKKAVKKTATKKVVKKTSKRK